MAAYLGEYILISTFPTAILGIILATLAGIGSLIRFYGTEFHKNYMRLTAALFVPAINLTQVKKRWELGNVGQMSVYDSYRFLAVLPFAMRSNELVCKLRLVMPPVGLA